MYYLSVFSVCLCCVVFVDCGVCGVVFCALLRRDTLVLVLEGEKVFKEA